ncbi:MAG: hypothetical protein JO323_22795 [Acidobacteriia bacterium]|nr:hypothetical protein [Terriglobia bacterium]
MKLADLRKISVRQNLRIRFQLSNGLECVITEHGVAQVPALRRVPDFNLEQELSSVASFVLEPAGGDKNRPAAPRSLNREELSALASPVTSAAAEHDEE